MIRYVCFFGILRRPSGVYGVALQKCFHGPVRSICYRDSSVVSAHFGHFDTL